MKTSKTWGNERDIGLLKLQSIGTFEHSSIADLTLCSYMGVF